MQKVCKRYAKDLQKTYLQDLQKSYKIELQKIGEKCKDFEKSVKTS